MNGFSQKREIMDDDLACAEVLLADAREAFISAVAEGTARGLKEARQQLLGAIQSYEDAVRRRRQALTL